jgi:putative peptidoglycan lipid II flippase
LTPRSQGGAPLVAAGILLSRLAGLVRQRVLSHYLGLSLPADAFNLAFRIPNFLQNLFGEGVLSASFIPSYARLRSEGRDEEARRLAGAVLGILSIAVAILVALGITTAPWLVTLLAPGFEGPKRELTIELVRVLFPGVGLLVFSAWCLSILNSHRRFFLSYAAPVLWNCAIILATVLAPAAGPLETVALSSHRCSVCFPGSVRASAGGTRGFGRCSATSFPRSSPAASPRSAHSWTASSRASFRVAR